MGAGAGAGAGDCARTAGTSTIADMRATTTIRNEGTRAISLRLQNTGKPKVRKDIPPRPRTQTEESSTRRASQNVLLFSYALLASFECQGVGRREGFIERPEGDGGAARGRVTRPLRGPPTCNGRLAGARPPAWIRVPCLILIVLLTLAKSLPAPVPGGTDADQLCMWSSADHSISLFRACTEDEQK